MNLNRIQNDYIERYGEVEGKQLFKQYCEFMAEAEAFPTCLVYAEKIRELNEGL